jgi:phosphatidylinositol glycan class K
MLLSSLLWLLVVLLFQPTHARNHTSNWAIIVDTSTFWFNYRHAANALAIYRAVKSGGIPDSRIILMIGEDHACNARNVDKGTIWDEKKQLYGSDVEVDYRGHEVTEENLLRVLMGRHTPGTPPNKRLLTDDRSNVLVYMTGHGGDQFIKFRDTTTVSAPDLADALEQMKAKGRFHELLFMADTCQGATLYDSFRTPGVVAIGSSQRKENSYAFEHDWRIGIALVDRFTHATLTYFDNHNYDFSLQQLFSEAYPYSLVQSHAMHKSWMNRPLDKVPISDFFTSIVDVDMASNLSSATTTTTSTSTSSSSITKNNIADSHNIDDDSEKMKLLLLLHRDELWMVK